MAVKIFIRRTVPQDKAKAMIPLLRQMRASATTQPGYISGETFFHLERPEECLVISRWTSLEHWQKWIKEPRRKELHENIQKHLDTKIEYNIYGVGLW